MRHIAVFKPLADATKPMNPFTSIADTPLQLQQPQVRDLAWSLLSPSLLSTSALTTSPLPVRHPLQATAWAAQPQLLRDWLLRMDNNPEPLLNGLAQRPTRRLGVYYERLWQFALQHAPGIQLLAANLPVRHAGKTLGEFDLLLQDDEGQHHLELAVKFYLAQPSASGLQLDHWLGPASHDRLDIKLAQMCGPQLALSQHAAAEKRLAEHCIQQPKVSLWMGGYLFHPWPDDCQIPSSVSSDHLKGYWVPQCLWARFQEHHGADCWYLLPRLSWLAPAGIHTPLLSATYDNDAGLSRPVLLARLSPEQNGRCIQLQRVFVVPDHWPGEPPATEHNAKIA